MIFFINYLFLFLFLFQYQGGCEKIYYDNIGKQMFSMRVDEVKYFQPNPFKDIFFLNYTIIDPTNKRTSGLFCRPNQRNIDEKSKHFLSFFQILQKNPTYLVKFLDSLITEKNIIFLDNFLTIYNFVYEVENNTVLFKGKIESPKKISVTKASLFYNKNCSKITVFSSNYSYVTNFPEDNLNTTYENPSQNYPYPEAFATLGDYVFIAAGTLGIQVFSQTKSSPVLTHIKYFTSELALPSGYNITDIYTDSKKNYLYLLCNTYGVYLNVFKSKTLEIIKINEFFMNYVGGSELKVINNSVILLKGFKNNDTNPNKFFLFEIFFFFNEQNKVLEFKLNRFIESNYIGKIYCGDEYCVVGWDQLNLILFYGFPIDIVNNYFQSKRLFLEPHMLSGFIKPDLTNKYHHTLILATKNGITFMHFEEKYSRLRCHVSSRISRGLLIDLLGKHIYNVTIWTDTCESKKKAQDYSIFNYCKINALLEVELFEGFSKWQKKKLMIVVGISLSVFFIIVAVTSYFFYKNYKKKINKLQGQLDRIKNVKYDIIDKGEKGNLEENDDPKI